MKTFGDVAANGPTEILIHIGPPKTASTTAQRLLNERSEELARAGVRVITKHRDAVTDLIGYDYLRMAAVGPTGSWPALQQAATSAHGERVIISNELLAWLNDAEVSEATDALGRDRVRVIFSMRSLPALVASYWHEFVTRGGSISLSEWCHTLISTDGQTGDLSDSSIRFWQSEDSALLARRWANVLGSDRVTCVYVAEGNPKLTLTRITDAFGISADQSEAPVRIENQSASQQALEALQQFNQLVERFRIPYRFRHALARYAREQLEARGAYVGPKPRVPEEFLAAFSVRQERMVRELQATGVRVVGEESDLTVAAREASPSEPVAPSAQIRIELGPLAVRVVRRVFERLLWTTRSSRKDHRVR
jgi:hypothetical protein